MFKVFVVVVAAIYVSFFFDLVTSQCGCSCRFYNRCSCCTTTTNVSILFTNNTARVCSTTCADTISGCSAYLAYCNSTTQVAFQAALLNFCPCTCGLCATTNFCANLTAGANIGPCINGVCGAGSACNTTTGNCICQ
uniref:ShKT domain-containing protein n=1 Tax=Acrobeloides nanus TaxID=290746 RepID=A0A914CUH1_9BILA